MIAQKTQAPSQAVTLKTPVRYLRGVGPEKDKLFARLGVRTLGDLLGWFPRRHEDRAPVKKIEELAFQDKECVRGTVMSRGLVRFGGRSVFRVVISDPVGAQHAAPLHLFAVFYNQPYLAQAFKPKSHVVLYGKAERKGRRAEMVHPEYEIFASEPPERTAHHGRRVPVYPLTEDLSQKSLRQAVYEALFNSAPAVQDPLPPELRKAHRLSGLNEALRQIHFPDDEKKYRAAYERLVFEEFFYLQLFVEIKRARLKAENPALAHLKGAAEVSAFMDSLPFELTGGQRKAVSEIVRDLGSSRVMNRLIQGDVGSGKTPVAAAALYYTAQNGFQGALMAPTEVLAQQLYFQMMRFLAPHGIRIGYLAQSVEPEEKERVRARLAEGEISVVVGTHSLLEENVRFKNLALAVVDEQHKFGVDQRSRLRQKSGQPAHFLLMTATPIPRTLAMTLYGDMDVSVIADKPKGREPVRTLWFRDAQRLAVNRWLKAVLEEGAQAYVICPWVDAEQDQNSKNAVRVYDRMRSQFPARRVGLLHGRMKSAEKEEAMRVFREGRVDILVSTVLVEVGVDVPRARFMIIEHGEKFGLAQLHQLRGRIGRGDGESFCVVFSESESAESTERLEAFVATDSGFEIAEKDLAQRGAGELHGERQHGFLRFRLGDLARDSGLMERAKAAAKTLVEKDVALALPEHRPLKQALKERYA